MTNDPENRFNPSDKRRPRRLEESQTEEVAFPLVWIVIGGLAGLIVIGLISLGVVNLVRKGAVTPTPQVLPPLVEPVEATMPTETPAPAETVSQPAVDTVETPSGEEPAAETEPVATAEQPAEQPPSAPVGDLVVDGYAKVTGTDGTGLSMRAGPGRNNARVGLAEEDGTVTLLLLDGPREDENAEDYTWWFIQHPDGTEGWVVEDYLVPAEAP